jgi:RimJ/RimL family protein N-acetyltransferase
MNILNTERLSLNLLSLDDAAFFLALVNEPGWLENIRSTGVHTLDEARAAIASGPMASQEERGFSFYLVRRQADQAALGICGLKKREKLRDVDLGYAFLSQHAGQGYALEAARGVVQYARTVLALPRLAGITSPGNLRSQQLLTKLGFALEQVVILPGDERETQVYGLELAP